MRAYEKILEEEIELLESCIPLPHDRIEGLKDALDKYRKLTVSDAIYAEPLDEEFLKKLNPMTREILNNITTISEPTDNTTYVGRVYYVTMPHTLKKTPLKSLIDKAFTDFAKAVDDFCSTHKVVAMLEKPLIRLELATLGPAYRFMCLFYCNTEEIPEDNKLLSNLNSLDGVETHYLEVDQEEEQGV